MVVRCRLCGDGVMSDSARWQQFLFVVSVCLPDLFQWGVVGGDGEVLLQCSVLEVE
jgi:hypothetical protein